MAGARQSSCPLPGRRHSRCALEPVLATGGTSPQLARHHRRFPLPAREPSLSRTARARQRSPRPSRPSRFPASNRAARRLGPPAPRLLPSRPNRTACGRPGLPATADSRRLSANPRRLGPTEAARGRLHPPAAAGSRHRPAPPQPGLTASCLPPPSPSRRKPAPLAVSAQAHPHLPHALARLPQLVPAASPPPRCPGLAAPRQPPWPARRSRFPQPSRRPGPTGRRLGPPAASPPPAVPGPTTPHPQPPPPQVARGPPLLAQ